MNDFKSECKQVVDDFKISFDKLKKSNVNPREYSEGCTNLMYDVTLSLGRIAIKHSIHNGKFGASYLATFSYQSECQHYLEKNI